MADKEILQSVEEQTEIAVQTEPADTGTAAVKKPKFITKDVIKCVVVLAVIALVAGVLLGVMNWLTYVDPDETIMKKVGEYYSVSLENVVKDDSRVVNADGKSKVNGCFVAKGADGNAVGYCYYSVGSAAKDGTIELMVFIGTDGVIKEITVYEQGETAGYFKKVEDANKSKYVGIDVDEIDSMTLLSSKYKGATAPGEVAAVSGATYTSTGYHNAVAAAVYSYKNYNKEA